MKWTKEQEGELYRLCFKGKSNAELAEIFDCHLKDIHAARGRLGITIDKVKAAKAAMPQYHSPATPAGGSKKIINKTEANRNGLICANCNSGNLILCLDFGDDEPAEGVSISYRCEDCGEVHFICKIYLNAFKPGGLDGIHVAEEGV